MSSTLTCLELLIEIVNYKQLHYKVRVRKSDRSPNGPHVTWRECASNPSKDLTRNHTT